MPAPHRSLVSHQGFADLGEQWGGGIGAKGGEGLGQSNCQIVRHGRLRLDRRSQSGGQHQGLGGAVAQQLFQLRQILTGRG